MAVSIPHSGEGGLENHYYGDDDIPPLEYARVNELCRNYLTDCLAFIHIDKLQASASYHLSDDAHFSRLDLGVEPPLNERLVLSQDGARFLQLIKQAETLEEADTLILTILGSKDVVKSKLELPLLKSDHVLDCKEFAGREDFEIRFKDVRLPLEIVDEENGEGLLVPSRYRNSEQQTKNHLEKEKIEIPKDAVAYLQMAVKGSWTQEDGEELWDREQAHKRMKALEPVTPPISPAYSLPRQYEPSSSSPTYHLPILSDPESLSREDLENIEGYIFKQDIPTPIRNFMIQQNSPSSNTSMGDAKVNFADIYPLAEFVENSTPPSAKLERIKRGDLKVEEPLSPTLPTTTEKRVRFCEEIEHMLLDPIPANDPEQYDKFFVEATFGTDYKNAMQQAEQETLIEADTTARVNERIMDFSTPSPPWTKFQEAQDPVQLLSLQIEMVNSVINPKLEVWTRSSRKQLDLRWNPFPHGLYNIALQETQGADNEAWKVFVSPEDKQDIDSSNLTWKPQGLRVMNVNNGDDEIELGIFSNFQKQDMAFLVRKRKKELEQDDLEEVKSKSQFQTRRQLLNNEAQASVPTKRPETSVPALLKSQNGINTRPHLLLGGEFSAGNLLANYKELRGAKKLKLVSSPAFLGVQKELVPTISVSQHDELQLPIRHSPIEKAATLPIPPLKAPAVSMSVLVSSTLLKHRALVRRLEGLLPSLTLIERDFTAYNTAAWMPGSVTRSPISSPLDSEADLIISPSTGIILTTVQKVKQMPLPGSKAKTAIRDRLEKVTTRYEKLIVLVTEGRSDETTNGLDENDCIILSEFVGFASGFATLVMVQFVTGGEETLAKWLASTIVQHRLGELEFNLLTEETHWELFLRRAGMNAFAAQVIVADLKAPDGVDAKSSSKAGQFGIAAFVEMNREQRIRRFGSLCGKRLVARVSDVVDGKWG